MLLADFITHVESIAPLSLAAPWDNSGMQVAAERADIHTVALCLDPTPASITKALALGAQAVVSHHPLLMQPRLPAQTDAFHAVLKTLLTADAALYAAHTSLDCNPRGTVTWLAQELHLRDCTLLEHTGQLGDGTPCGFGTVGTLPTPYTLEALLTQLSQHISLDVATLCGPAVQRIQRVAYCTGSGASLMQYAADAGADIFITGDVKHHAAIDTTVPILDVGHHSLEEEMMRRLALQLAKDLPHLTVHFVPSPAPLRPAAHNLAASAHSPEAKEYI